MSAPQNVCAVLSGATRESSGIRHQQDHWVPIPFHPTRDNRATPQPWLMAKVPAERKACARLTSHGWAKALRAAQLPVATREKREFGNEPTRPCAWAEGDKSWWYVWHQGKGRFAITHLNLCAQSPCIAPGSSASLLSGFPLGTQQLGWGKGGWWPAGATGLKHKPYRLRWGRFIAHSLWAICAWDGSLKRKYRRSPNGRPVLWFWLSC